MLLDKTNRYSSDDFWHSLESFNNCPEKDFILAILNRAIKDAVGLAPYAKCHATGKFVIDEAKEWLESSEDAPYSAIWCFNELGVDRDIVLKELYKYYKANNYRLNIITKRVNANN